jgi:hypothetical protein
MYQLHVENVTVREHDLPKTNPNTPWNNSSTRVVMLCPSFSILKIVLCTSAKAAWNTASTEYNNDIPIAARDCPKFVNAAIIVTIISS